MLLQSLTLSLESEETSSIHAAQTVQVARLSSYDSILKLIMLARTDMNDDLKALSFNRPKRSTVPAEREGT